MTLWLLIALAFLAGAALSIQAPINAVLAGGVGHSLWAAVISFAVGLITLLLICALTRAPLPAPSAANMLPWWAWVGGVFGAVYVTASIAAVPRLGAATLIALVITGQMLTSLVLDHFGAFGLQEHGLTIWRAVGALLLIVGVVLIRTA